MSNIGETELRPFEYELPAAPQGIVGSWVTRLQAVAIVTALLAQVEAGLVQGMTATSPQTATDATARIFGYSGVILNLGATLSAVLLLLAVTSVPTAARMLYMTCNHGYPRKVFEYGRLQDSNNDAPSPKITTPTANVGNVNADTYAYLATNTFATAEPDVVATIRSFNQLLAVQGNAEETIMDAFGIARGWGLMLRHCIFCFLGGCVCTFVHVTLLLWLQESTKVAAILMGVVFVGFVPPLMVYMFGMDSKKCAECAAEKKRPPKMSHVFIDPK